jgi:hypothetical protein
MYLTRFKLLNVSKKYTDYKNYILLARTLYDLKNYKEKWLFCFEPFAKKKKKISLEKM